jgi:epoxide hydrolase-like predicted phosphatase
MIHAVIFDLGGVLVRTEDPAPRARLAARLGMSPAELSRTIYDSESAILATRGEITTESHLESLRQALGLTPEDFPAVPTEFWGGDTVDSVLVDYVRSLRPRYKTALLSNAWDNLRRVIEEEWQFTDAFDEIVISAEVGMAKPDRGIYQLALSRLEVEPEAAVFVDDFQENIEGALAVGMQAIRFRSHEQIMEDLGKLLNH